MLVLVTVNRLTHGGGHRWRRILQLLLLVSVHDLHARVRGHSLLKLLLRLHRGQCDVLEIGLARSQVCLLVPCVRLRKHLAVVLTHSLLPTATTRGANT